MKAVYMGRHEKILEALRNKGYRATPQRISVARTVLASREHPTVETIYNEVRRSHPTISLSTVYNTLHVLKELNMVQELGFNDVGVRYDPNTMPHVNLVCKSCGEIYDLDEPLLNDVLQQVERRTGFRITGQRIDVYGLCKRCAKDLVKSDK